MKKPTRTNIVFFGNERLATAVGTQAPVLKALLQAGYCIKAVITSQTVNRSRSERRLEIEELAKQHNVETLSPANSAELEAKLKDLRPNIGVLVAYGRIVPKALIDLFPRGIVNIHPSLLPAYRGPTPIEQTILDGQKITGVSLMQLSAQMDAGPVYDQAALNLRGDESKHDLADQLSRLGADLLIKHLPAIISGDLEPKPQDEKKATYTPLISKSDGLIDWNKSAQQLEREIRAYASWPGSRTKLAGKDVIITKAHTVPANHPENKPGDIEVVKEIGALMVECSNGYLCIERLKPAGKREMSAREFTAGLRDKTNLKAT